MILTPHNTQDRRPGFSLSEAIVVLTLVVITALFVMMALPRSRESARFASCQRNLSQIGIALLQYGQIQHQYPTSNRYDRLDDSPKADESEGPLRSLLITLQIPDFTELVSPDKPVDRRTNTTLSEAPIRGFVCASDPRATAGSFRAPVSYRGSTGSSPVHPDGLFALGRLRTPAEVDAGDGAGYTAAFAERLVGTGEPSPAMENYQLSASPVPPQGCGPSSDGTAYRGDAGSSWFHSDYRSTLYNHALPPNSPSSCIAADGQSALLGASSGHTAGVNLLLLDGSLRTIRPTIDLKVWRDFGTIGSPKPTP